jgi:DNA-binding transcriptional regulator YdaS (Cro superfamily)
MLQKAFWVCIDFVAVAVFTLISSRVLKHSMIAKRLASNKAKSIESAFSVSLLANSRIGLVTIASAHDRFISL